MDERNLPAHVRPVDVQPDAGAYERFYRTVTCCREWEVSAIEPIGPCGICGRRPA